MKEKEQAKAEPKYIVRRLGDDGIGFYIIHKKEPPIFLVERYDDVPFQIFVIGHVTGFDPDDNIEATKVFEIPIDTVKKEEMFYTQEGAIGEAFRLAKMIKEETV